MTFPVFGMITVHFVLRGTGQLQVGDATPIAFSPTSVLIVPARKSHWIGEGDQNARPQPAEQQCTLIGDGLVEFTAGNGDEDILLVCAAVAAPAQAALSLFDLLRVPVLDERSTSVIPGNVFDALRDEVVRPGLGTQAICQALMKIALIALVRNRLTQGGGLPNALQHPRLARALVTIIDNPAAVHTVESLAAVAGMSRASFSDHFSRAMGQGPIDFVQKSRLRVAARLLKVTDLPIKVIAESVGYAGTRPFSRAFEAAHGRSPRRFRDDADGASDRLKIE